MNYFKQLKRLFQINNVFAKNGLDKLVVTIKIFAPIRFIVYLNPWNWFRKNTLTRGEALRMSFEELGPIFIKFGQALSTRPDILPPDIAKELLKLQDRVPPFPNDKALHMVELAYGRPAHEVFAYFEEQPLASASMAQVHAATLKSGEDVVVKILRPDMRNKIEQDIAILKTIAGLLGNFWSDGKRLKPTEIVEELERSLYDELDLQREAANGGQLRRNFTNSPLLYIPEIYWDYVRKNILVMERIYGIPVADVARLEAQGTNIKLLAERGLIIFFTQVFRDCFFHADMHPGNIFVSQRHPEDPQYICIDFGIIGTLTDSDKRYLAENLLAFFNRDYRRVAQLHIESGWVLHTTRVDEFESAIRTVCEPIFGRPLKNISFALIVLELFQVARRFKMDIQPQLVLLQKTLLAVEGLGRQLYPELDLWATAKPFLEKWVRDQVGPKAFVKHLRENIPFMMEQLPHMPRLLNDIMLLTKEQKLLQKERQGERRAPLAAEKRWYGGLGAGVFFVMLLFSGVAYFNVLDHQTLAVISLGAAMLGAFVAFINRNKSNLKRS